MTAVAGKKAQVKVTGAGLALTLTPLTELVSGTTFQVTDPTKRILDRVAQIDVYRDGGLYSTTAVAGTLINVNRLTGTVTVAPPGGAGHTWLMTSTYLPASLAAEAKQFQYDILAQMLEDNQFGDADVTRVQGLQDVQGTLGRWYSIDTYFTDALLAGNPVVIEFSSDSSVAFNRRAWALLNKDSMSAAINGLIEESVSFVGTPDVDGRILSR